MGEVFMLSGCAAIGVGIYLVWAGARARSWPWVLGEVGGHRFADLSDHDASWDPVTDHQAIVVYRYRVGNRSYCADRLRFGLSQGSRLRAAARESAEHRFPVGQPVTVFYNPRNPSDAVLKPGVSASAVLITIVGLVMFGVGLFGFLHPGSLTWR